MPKVTSTSPEYTGISVKVDTYTKGVLNGSPKEVGHLDTVGAIVDKSRASKKYTPLNESIYDEIVAMGAMTQGKFTATVLYDPKASEGINVIEQSIDASTDICLIIVLNDKGARNATTYTQKCKVSSFKVEGEAEGKFKASFEAERIGTATVLKAS